MPPRVTRRLNSRLRPSTTLLKLLGFEALLVALAVVACVAAVVAQAPGIVAKARASGQFFDARPLQAEMAEQLALEGSVPEAVEPALGLRPAVSASEAAAPMLWLCGDRPAPTGYVAPPASAASGPLFSVCREGRASW
jgi:hypothetical protein